VQFQSPLTAIGTVLLAWRVGHGGRITWYLTAALAVFVLGNLVIQSPRLTAMFRSLEGVALAMTGSLLSLYALGQVIALICAIGALKRAARYRRPIAPAT